MSGVSSISGVNIEASWLCGFCTSVHDNCMSYICVLMKADITKYCRLKNLLVNLLNYYVFILAVNFTYYLIFYHVHIM